MPLIADRYEPTGNAAWGGIGEVNECIDKNLSRKVMLKRVFKPSDFPRLLDEQKALIKLRSKHVVQLLDVVKFTWNKDTVTCLVLEHIDGDDLDKLSFKPDIEFQKVLWQIASGLTDIHAAGVIHRDIKPQNIRRDRFWIVKIFDFGLAREIGIDDKTKSITGTLGFMAPELFGNSTISFSPAVDTYAFGRTALALLGRWPPTGKALKVQTGTVAKEFPGLNAAVCGIIEACLDLSATDRPTMSEVADVLSRDLIRGRHRARIVQDGRTVYELHSKNKVANITSAVGNITIQYDGNQFLISAVSGSVFINNKRVSNGTSMLAACVITIGEQGSSRAFLTFDVSNPEIAA
jgi:eukaryotic-like serine/threonine-protein kinase